MLEQQSWDHLTQEHESHFSEWKAKWITVGLCTEPADRAKAEAALKECYRLGGLIAPEKIVWCGSPFSQGLTRAIVLDPKFKEAVSRSVWEHIRNSSGSNISDHIRDTFSHSVRLIDTAGVKQNLIDNVREKVSTAFTAVLKARMQDHLKDNIPDSVWKNIWDGVWESVWDSLWSGIDKGIRNMLRRNSREALEVAIKESLNNKIGDGVKHKVWDGVRDIAWNSVRDTIGNRSKVRTSVWDSLWSPIRVEVWDNIAMHIVNYIRASANDSVECSGYGQHDANWLSFYDYFREVGCLSKETEKLCGLRDLAKHAGWFVPHEHICWISERPRVISLDEQGRLHSSKGPALAYPDGWSIYAKNGMPIYAINGMRTEDR